VKWTGSAGCCCPRSKRPLPSRTGPTLSRRPSSCTFRGCGTTTANEKVSEPHFETLQIRRLPYATKDCRCNDKENTLNWGDILV
jgi:hypothetical protein